MSGVTQPLRTVRARWAGDKAARNAWMTIPDPYLVEIVGSDEHIDAVTFDMQHGLFDRRSVVEAIRAASASGVTSLVRLPGLDEALIGYLLDAGVGGLILPMTESGRQAEEFRSFCTHPPGGRRSHGPTRAGLPSRQNAEPPVLFAMIESYAGLSAVDEIAAVDGLDGLFVGPGDLGLSLGIGGGQNRVEPEFLKALETIETSARQANRLLAIHASSADYAARMAAKGYRLVTVWVDVAAVRSSLKTARLDWQEAGAAT